MAASIRSQSAGSISWVATTWTTPAAVTMVSRTALLVHHSSHDLLNRRRRADVGLQRDADLAAGSDQFRRLLGAGGVPIDGRDRGALGGESHAARPPDAAARSGHEGSATSKSWYRRHGHDPLLMYRTPCPAASSRHEPWRRFSPASGDSRCDTTHHRLATTSPVRDEAGPVETMMSAADHPAGASPQHQDTAATVARASASSRHRRRRIATTGPSRAACPAPPP